MTWVGPTSVDGGLGAYGWSMTWPEEFSHGYDEWTAGVTEDIGFYVGLAVGPPVQSSNSPSAAVASPSDRAGNRRAGDGVDTSPAMLVGPNVEPTRPASNWSSTSATWSILNSTSQQRSSSARFGPCSTSPRGPPAAASSSGWRPRCVLAAGSPGTRSRRSPLRRPCRWCPRRRRAFAHTDHFAVGDNRVDIVLDTAPRARCGGRRRTSGSASSTSLASRLRPSTATSIARRSTPQRRVRLRYPPPSDREARAAACPEQSSAGANRRHRAVRSCVIPVHLVPRGSRDRVRRSAHLIVNLCNTSWKKASRWSAHTAPRPTPTRSTTSAGGGGSRSTTTTS